MANHPSALKRDRQSKKRRERNRGVLTSTRSAAKKALAALSTKNPDQINAALKEATAVIDSAASKGVIPKNRASRKVSRLAKKAKKALSAPPSS
ncbi:MAG: 30S ribosomal protein S20 [Candidatus Manganitrophaceae bacterium]